MQFCGYPYGPLDSNLYILSGFPSSDKMIVVDPSVPIAKVRSESFDVKLDMDCIEAVFITHGHFDHMMYVDEWYEALGSKVPFYLNEKDYACIKDPVANCSEILGEPLSFSFVPTPSFESNNKLFFDGKVRCRVINTPGHSPGEVCYLFEDLERGEKVLFTGDMLFAGSVGRTDFYGGDMEIMLQSAAALRELKTDAVVLPGHGPATSLLKEIRTNPFFQI